MKSVTLITGSTGSGKSTLAASMGKGAHVFSTGALVRHLMKDSTDENPVAPVRLNAIVYAKLCEVIEKYNTVVVECMPRNEEQVEWIDGMREMGISVSVIRCVCDYNVRMSRVISRDMTDPSRLELDRAKIMREGDDFCDDSYFTRLLLNVQHTEIDTTHAHPDVSSPPTMIGEHEVDGLINMAVNIHDKLTNKEIRASRMCDRAIEELNEAKDALAQEVEVTGHASEEIIDALFFIFVALHSLGVDGDGLMSLYTRKYSVNSYRINSGTKPSATTGEK
jgi:hypothetical protein